jgi:menaquinone-dependent protoporphyrinogen oxidase
MIRMIMYMTKGPTDTSQTYEFTDWVKVDEFADTLAKQKLTMPRD